MRLIRGGTSAGEGGFHIGSPLRDAVWHALAFSLGVLGFSGLLATGGGITSLPAADDHPATIVPAHAAILAPASASRGPESSPFPAFFQTITDREHDALTRETLLGCIAARTEDELQRRNCQIRFR